MTAKVTDEMVEAAWKACPVGRFDRHVVRGMIEAAFFLARTPPPSQHVVGIVPPHCTGYSFVFEPGVLHVKKDGSGYIAVDEDDFVLEDDRDGEGGSVHWIARMDASEIAALRDFLNGAPQAHLVAIADTAMIDAAFKALPPDASGTIGAGEMQRVIEAALRAANPKSSGIIAAFENAYPDLYWHVAKGKITACEPLYRAIIMDEFGAEIGEGESDVSADEAFRIAIEDAGLDIHAPQATAPQNHVEGGN